MLYCDFYPWSLAFMFIMRSCLSVFHKTEASKRLLHLWWCRWEICVIDTNTNIWIEIVLGFLGLNVSLNLPCFSFFRHRKNDGDGHVLFICWDWKEKEGSFPRLHVGCTQKWVWSICTKDAQVSEMWSS